MELTFSELRQARIKVLNFTQEVVPDYALDMRSSLTDDLSLVELDGYQYLDDFQKEFEMELSSSAYGYVCPEVLKMGFLRGCLHLAMFLFLLPVWLLAYGLDLRKEVSLKQKMKRNRHALTLGDLTLSLVVGAFTKREETVIRLKKSR